MNILNPKADASKVEPTATRIDPHIYEVGAAMDRLAQDVGAKSGYLDETMGVIVKARQDYEGGPFAVMFKVMDKMDAETIEALPDPDSETGNNPGRYKIRIMGNKGKPIVKEKKFYHVLSDRLPSNVGKQQRIDMLELSMKDPVQFNLSSVPQEIKDMDQSYRKAEISRLEGELATSRTNVLSAFELLFAIRNANSLPGVTVNVLYALDAEGKEKNGQDGRPTEVENTRTPIVVSTTVEGRKAKDTTMLSVGSFKKLRPEVAREKGGTYTAFVESAPEVKRGTKGESTDQTGGSKPKNIATNDTAIARLTDLHEYFDVITSDTKQTNISALIGLLNKKEGSTDLLITVTEVRDFLTGILAKTYKSGERYQQATRAKAEAMAAEAEAKAKTAA